MKAKDLLTTDIGKWVAIRFEITDVDEDEDETAPLVAKPEGASFANHIHRDTTLEFTDPPAPVQEVGDVFLYMDNEFCLVGIDGKNAWLRYIEYGTHSITTFPLPIGYKFVRKGTAS